jgi:cytochrome c553
MDKCGADCFDCHDRKKLTDTPIPEYQRLKTCTKCHYKSSINNIIPVTPKYPALPLNSK